MKTFLATAFVALGGTCLLGSPSHAGILKTLQLKADATVTEAPSLPHQVAPDNADLYYDGRFDTTDPAGPRCEWSASSVRLTFIGKSVNARIGDSGMSDMCQVFVDGQMGPAIKLAPGTHVYRVFDAATAGHHQIRIAKRTEAFFGTVQFEGFELNADAKLLPSPAPKHRIEIIGDSISCGYGDEAADQNQHFTDENENGCLAYGAVAARDLHSGYTGIAWSGRCMWPKNTMGEIYDRIIPTDPSSRWDFKSDIPDVVVINLGTNDFRDPVDNAGWIKGYEAFIEHVRSHYPHALIYCAVSPMIAGSALDTIKSDLRTIIMDENAAGDKRVKYLQFATQDGKNGYGADWHPSIKTHEIMARTLEDAINADLGW